MIEKEKTLSLSVGPVDKDCKGWRQCIQYNQHTPNTHQEQEEKVVEEEELPIFVT